MVVSRGGTRISHLLFVDDSFLYCHANLKEWNMVRHILDVYEKGIGQKVNQRKSSIFFSLNTLAITKQSILQEVGGAVCRGLDIYLGLPTMVGRSKYNSF